MSFTFKKSHITFFNTFEDSSLAFCCLSPPTHSDQLPSKIYPGSLPFFISLPHQLLLGSLLLLIGFSTSLLTSNSIFSSYGLFYFFLKCKVDYAIPSSQYFYSTLEYNSNASPWRPAFFAFQSVVSSTNITWDPCDCLGQVYPGHSQF